VSKSTLPTRKTKELPVSALTVKQAETLYLGLDHPLLNDPSNNGQTGVNRCAAKPQIKAPNGVDHADTDVDAVKAWLSLSTNPNTWRQKRKEIERFMLWLMFERRTLLSSAAINDFTDYLKFIADPPENWKGKRVPRGPKWRPFEDKLKASSVQQAKVHLADCIGWLCDLRYLDFNITNNKNIKVTQNRNNLEVHRHIPSSLLIWIWDWLQSLPEDDKEAIRWRFACEFLVRTGLREAEFANASMGSIYREVNGNTERWYINVTGKGNKVRNVPIVNIEPLIKYRTSMGLAPLPTIGDSTPLWLPLRGKNNVQPAAIYTSIKKMVKAAGLHLKNQAMEEPDLQKKRTMLANADLLGSVSPHWFRHSYATHAINEGTSLKSVQIALGHSSVITTECYINTEKRQVHDDMAKSRNPFLELPGPT